METVVELAGVPYTFVTSNGTTTLRIENKTTPSEDTLPETLSLPDIWLITRSNGVPLFALRPDSCDKPFRIMNADKLYAEKIQWFEPLADFYRECVWINPTSNMARSAAYEAYKHHTWQSIIEFAIVDRGALMFAAGFPGDWKIQRSGGDGYLLCSVEGYPYWTDGLGQIPFAVDTFRMFWTEINNIEIAIRKTGATGLRWANGKPGGEDTESENVYDNFIILRASLWASENFLRKIPARENYGGLRGLSNEIRATTVFHPTSTTRLKNQISAETLTKYKTWAP